MSTYQKVGRFALTVLLAVLLTVIFPSTAHAISPRAGGPTPQQIDLPCIPPICGIDLPGPLPELPGISDIPGIDMPGIFNPFEWANNKVREAINESIEFIQSVLINPPRPEPGDWQQDFYGKALGVAPTIAILGMVALVAMATVIQRLTNNAFRAILVAVLVTAIAPSWFPFSDRLFVFRDSMAAVAQFYHGAAPDDGGWGLFFVPDLVNVIVSLIIGVFILVLAFVLAIVLFLYELAMIIAVWLFLPALATYSFGGWGRRFASSVLGSIFAYLSSGAALVVTIELGQVARDFLPMGTTSIGSALISLGTLIMTIVVAVKVWKLGKRSATHIVGNVNSITDIRGRVETMSSQPQKVDISALHARTLEPVPVRMQTPPTGKRVKKSVTEGTVEVGSAALAARMAGAAHPALAASVVLAAKPFGGSGKVPERKPNGP